MRDATKNVLIRLMKEKSVKMGSFKLKSGKESDFYVDVRQVSLNGYASVLIGELIVEMLLDGVIGIGGMETGSIPVAMSAVHQSGVHGFYIRKANKEHGITDRVVGLANLPSGSKVCLVEDTTSTGASLLEAIKVATEVGLEVVQCITVVDRQEGAEELLKQHGFILEHLITKEELKG